MAITLANAPAPPQLQSWLIAPDLQSTGAGRAGGLRASDNQSALKHKFSTTNMLVPAHALCFPRDLQSDNHSTGAHTNGAAPHSLSVLNRWFRPRPLAVQGPCSSASPGCSGRRTKWPLWIGKTGGPAVPPRPKNAGPRCRPPALGNPGACQPLRTPHFRLLPVFRSFNPPRLAMLDLFTPHSTQHYCQPPANRGVERCKNVYHCQTHWRGLSAPAGWSILSPPCNSHSLVLRAARATMPMLHAFHLVLPSRTQPYTLGSHTSRISMLYHGCDMPQWCIRV